jgi:intracellular septation protein A
MNKTKTEVTNTVITFTTPEDWVNNRVAVGSALLILYIVHFIFLLMAHLKKVKKEELVSL